MAIPRMTDDMDVIAKLADRPNDTQGLTAAQLKARFDKSGVDIQDYINNTLLPYLESGAAAGNMGIYPITGLDAETVQAALEEIYADRDVIWVTYGSTSYADVRTAHEAGKLVAIDNGSNTYLLTYCSLPEFQEPIVFLSFYHNAGIDRIYWAQVDKNNAWTTSYKDVPRPDTGSANTPYMDGVRDVGSAYSYARADHRHPSDTSKANAEDVPTKTSDLTNDSGYITEDDLPDAATAAPLMDGTAAVGSSGKYAREDHVHPSDTSKITMPSGGSVGQVLKKTANGTEWANESGGGGTTEIFDAIYGTTTVSEIETAISNGKLLRCTYDGQQYYLGFTATSLIRSYIFFKSNGSEVTVCSIDADTGVWSHGYRIIPSAYNSNPAMDGTASAGSSTFFSRGDHVHPSDTTKADKVTVVTVSDAGAVTQALDAGKIYDFTGALTSLTITLNAAAAPAQYHFRFDSGSTAVSLTLPQTVVMPTGFQVEANKHYEIDILDGYGVAQSW